MESADEESLRCEENKEFVSYVCKEIDDFFRLNGELNAVMLFPPFSSYRRRLIHLLVQCDYSNRSLCTFSIGEEPRRRTVVCSSSLRKNDVNTSIDSNSERSSFISKTSGHGSNFCKASLNKVFKQIGKPKVETKVESENNERHRKVRKTIEYYVPPHLRKLNSELDGNNKSPKETTHKRLSSDKDTLGNKMKILEIDGQLNVSSESVQRTASSTSPEWKPVVCASTLLVCGDPCSYLNLVIPILDDNEENDIRNEVGQVAVVEIKGLVSDSSENTDYENGTMLEIYDLPENTKSDDLAQAFKDFIGRGFRLRWVDSSHVLAIFSSLKTAEEALTYDFSPFKIRPISQGTALSQEIARTVILPSSFRPKTCSSSARRLLSGALGLKVLAPTPERKSSDEKVLNREIKKKDAS